MENDPPRVSFEKYRFTQLVIKCVRLRHATAMPFHDQQARSARSNKGNLWLLISSGVLQKSYGMAVFCHTVMTLRNVSVAL